MAKFCCIITLMILQGLLLSCESASGEDSSGIEPASIEDSSGIEPASREVSSGIDRASVEDSSGIDPASGEDSSGVEPASREDESGEDESGVGSGSGVGLEKNQTVLLDPREPSKKERDEAVQFLIPRKGNFEWDFKTDTSFKDKMASVTTDYCNENRTRCALKDTRRKRRSFSLDLYTADQVHLLPGYPSNASGSLQVAFYVQQPLGLFIGNISVLPRSTLADIVIIHKSALETAIGANISGIEVLFKPATPTKSPTAGPVEPSSSVWKWIAIGVGVGVVVIILIILIVFCFLKKSAKGTADLTWGNVLQEGIAMESLGPSSNMGFEDA